MWIYFTNVWSSWCGCCQSLNNDTTYERVPDTFCDIPCEGNGEEYCGAFEYSSVILLAGKYFFYL